MIYFAVKKSTFILETFSWNMALDSKWPAVVVIWASFCGTYRHNINNRYFSHSSIRNSVTNTSDRNYYLRNDYSHCDWVIHALREHLKRSSSTYIFHNNALLLSISQSCKIARCSFLQQSFVHLPMTDLAASIVSAKKALNTFTCFIHFSSNS